MHFQNNVSAAILFYSPDSVEHNWEKTDLWSTAISLPGVRVIRDINGAEAKLFRVYTSGYTVLYDAAGHLLFHGGITHFAGTPATTLGVKRSLHFLPTISQIISVHLSSAVMYSMPQSSIGTPYDAWTDRRGENSALERSAYLFQEHQRKIIHQTSHLFAYLMIVQWVGGSSQHS